MLIVNIQPVTAGNEPALLLSLVPMGVDIATLQLIQDLGGLLYRDASMSDWEGCPCDLIFEKDLGSYKVDHNRRFLK